MATRIGFVSDTHGSASAWARVVGLGLGACDLVVHCGDVLYHGPRNPLPPGHDPQKLAGLMNGLAGRLLLVKGNCDAEVDQVMLDYPMHHPALVVYAEGLGILAHHGDLLTAADVGRFASRSSLRLVVSGHTHIRLLAEECGVISLNPGSCALPKDPDGRPSFAVLEGTELALRDGIDGSTIRTRSLP